jgi:hypothetical protein
MNPEFLARLDALILEDTRESLLAALDLIDQNLDSLEENEKDAWIDTRMSLQTDLWEKIGFEWKDEDFEEAGIISIDYPDEDDHEGTRDDTNLN